MSPSMINASHLDTEVRAEIRAIEDERYRRQDAAGKPAPKKPNRLAPTPGPAPKPVVKKTKPKPPDPAPRVEKPPSGSANPSLTPTRASKKSLPPGSVILSPAEADALDHLLATHPQTRHLFKKGQR